MLPSVLYKLLFSKIIQCLGQQVTQPSDESKSMLPSVMYKRFLSDSPVNYQKAIEAAEAYPGKLEDGDIGWLHAKPFDPTPGHPQYFRLMFDLLNILQAMQIPANGRVLEVGSGPGWVTEVLLMLGYSVDALEPSKDLIAIAKERCGSLSQHYRHHSDPKVHFHQTTLEEVEFEAERFDAVLYFDVLHHVVDEELAFAKSLQFLKPGGSIGVVESAWHPDFKELEMGLMAEMKKYGTLENPFSIDYLDSLLKKSGFIDISRYVGVNGFFNERQLTQPLQFFGASPLDHSNNLTARKPSTEELDFPSCTDLTFKSSLQLKRISGAIKPNSRYVELVVEITNTGETLLTSRKSAVGGVTLALRRGLPGSDEFLECGNRTPLPEALIPGQSITTQLVFFLPSDVPHDGWELDGVAEGLFWFSTNGSPPCRVPRVLP